MKRIILSSALILCCICTSSVFGTHGMGGEITYRHLGGNKYKITAKYFRDCRGISASSLTISWFAGTPGTLSCGSGALVTTRTGIYDVSNVCRTEPLPCYPQNTTGTGQGIEMHVFEATADFNVAPLYSILINSSCPVINFYVNQCCRSNYITTGSANQEFYVSGQLYLGNLRKCLNKTNNSCIWHGKTQGYVCCNNPFYRNPGVTDTAERDSISFHFIPAIQGLAEVSVAYASPFANNYPVTPYCPTGGIKCTPMPNNSPPNGIYLNPINGDFIFTPTKCDEVAVVTIEAREWRKDTSGKRVLVGATRQDMQVIVKDNCAYNLSPTINGSFTNTIAASDKICIKFDINDELFKPKQTKPDSLLISFFGEHNDPVFTVLPDTIPNKAEVEFCWTTKHKDSSYVPYLFGISVNDNRCNPPSIASRGFTVLVLPKDSVQLKITPLPNCNNVRLSAYTLKSNTSKPSFSWKITDSSTGRVIIQSQIDSLLIKQLPKGTYTVVLKTTSKLYGYFTQVRNFSISGDLPTVTLGADSGICKGSSIQVQAIPTKVKYPLETIWNINGQADPNAKTLQYKIDSFAGYTKMAVEIRDSLGCSAVDEKVLFSYEKPTVAWVSGSLGALCADSTGFSLTDKILSPADSVAALGQLRVWGSLSKFGTNGLVDSLGLYSFVLDPTKTSPGDFPNGSGLTETITLSFTDTNQCTGIAKTTIQILPSPIVETKDRTYCQNKGGELNLDTLVKLPASKTGTLQYWNTIQAPPSVNKNNVIVVRSFNGVNQYWFQFGSKGLNQFAGNYTLLFTVKNANSGCSTSDTAMITLKPQPVMDTVGMKGYCSKPGNAELLQFFKADGKSIDSATSLFQITAFNNNTDPAKWSTVKLKNGHLFPTDAPFGKYTILCENFYTGCSNKTSNDVWIYANPTASFTTSPTDSAPLTLPYFSTQNKSSIPSSDGLNYTWYLNYPDLSMVNYSIAPTISYPPVNKIYKVRLITTSTKGCQHFFEKTLRVGFRTNSISPAKLQDFRIDPLFRVLGVEYQKIETAVYDASGKLVFTSTNNEAIFLPEGIYMYKMRMVGTNGILYVHSGKMVVAY